MHHTPCALQESSTSPLWWRWLSISKVVIRQSYDFGEILDERAILIIYYFEVFFSNCIWQFFFIDQPWWSIFLLSLPQEIPDRRNIIRFRDSVCILLMLSERIEIFQLNFLGRDLNLKKHFDTPILKIRKKSAHGQIGVTRYYKLFTNFLTWYESKTYIGIPLDGWIWSIALSIWSRNFS